MILLAVAGLGAARALATQAARQDAGATPAAGTSAAATRSTDAAPGSTTQESGRAADPDFDFFSDQPLAPKDLVELPPEKSRWLTVGGPAGLFVLFFVVMGVFWWMVPFKVSTQSIELHDFPTGVKRGLALALCLFGIAFCFGASEIWYQLQLHGSAEAYFAQMSLGKLIAFTHAHLFGFTTSFLIIGIPFSMQFNHVWQYQWIFPIGLAASLTDVLSWWGLKYLAPTFEWVAMFCGVMFSASYLYMLIALLRVLWFPELLFVSDRDYRQRVEEREARAQEARFDEGDF
ncbi:MAG TPA: hypothetical protein VM369_10610 [Candidatus Binatia bacterium]|nr:hypothetical protein [Candidatus Binatia bacterium]